MKSVVLMALTVTLAGCSAWPNLDAGRDPSDPTVKVPRQRYDSVMAGTIDYRPVHSNTMTNEIEPIPPKKRVY